MRDRERAGEPSKDGAGGQQVFALHQNAESTSRWPLSH